MTDEHLFKEAKRDPQALIQLYDRYAERIYKYVYFRVPNREDAEDIVGAVFEKLLTQDASLRFRQSFSAWIHTIAKNKVIDHWRMRKLTVPLEEIDMSTDSNTPQYIDDKNAVEHVLSGLCEQERAMLILHVLDGFTYKEIADMYDLSEVVVKKRFERLKKKSQAYVA